MAALVLAQRRAYDLALDAGTASTPISEAWIRRLHEEVCAAQDVYPVRTPQGPQFHKLAKGAYKRYPNHIHKADGREHAFAPVDATPAEMHRLVEVLRTDQFQTAHPVIQAAYAHYAVAAAHPFADGNGRVARVLASVFLIRATSLRLVVWADQKSVYLDDLAAADEGHPQRFVDFVLSQAVDLQLDVGEQLLVAGAPPMDASLQRIRGAMMAQGGLTHGEVDVVAARLLQELRDAVQSHLDGVSWPRGVERQVLSASGHVSVAGFRPPPDGALTGFVILGAAPAQVRVEVMMQVLVATSTGAVFAVRVHRTGGSDDLDLRLQEVHPVISSAARRRISAWTERTVRTALSEFAAQVEQVLH